MRARNSHQGLYQYIMVLLVATVQFLHAVKEDFAQADRRDIDVHRAMRTAKHYYRLRVVAGHKNQLPSADAAALHAGKVAGQWWRNSGKAQRNAAVVLAYLLHR